ncbi:MAG: radical SAM protein [Anaerolineales bacterium]|nr:radical SAM protein [Anaerolineales bacterium]
MFDFANILFSGPCNARCPYCIGKQVDPRLKLDNLNLYPPHNLEAFIELVQRHNVRQVVFSGVDTDPQLYRHEARLLARLRRSLGPQIRFSLHTNGRLALRRMAIFNQYDRACISFPSFDPPTYRALMGVPHPPDLVEIVRQARIPVKVSCLVVERNAPQMAEFLARCQEIGVRRVVLRKLYGEKRPWRALLEMDGLGLVPAGRYRNNPVYDYNGMQVTLWDFLETESASINLFSSGLISEQYLLAQAGLPPETHLPFRAAIGRLLS